MSLASFCVALSLISAPVEIPKVVDDRLQLELVLQEPDIVTPTGLTIDAKGRVLVIESHTHFRPDGYQGPPHDRILLIDPAQKPAKPKVWFEGTKYTMNLAKAPDDSIYVATRSEIFRLRDTDGDDKADERTPIAHLETAGNYPHNGLSGFAFRYYPDLDELNEVYFGFGENLGADYKLIGSNGTALVGGGEGGNIYACRYDGSKLRRVATGFWNPFHMTFNDDGQLFAVDNDPDSRPPCRLLHIVEGGDYGYRFRNGRKGTHPFTSWNGELPGTLPMVAGTGEAPSAVVSTDMFDDVDDPQWPFSGLLVTSWGDHRIELYPLQWRGESFTSAMRPIIIGGENFRPVGMAEAPDGSIYFSDWVDRSYPLHGKGRVWRLSKKPVPPEPPSNVRISREHGGFTRTYSDAEIREQHQTAWAKLGLTNPQDPFVWQRQAHYLADWQSRRPPLVAKSAADFLNEFATPRNANSYIWAAVAARDANPANAKVLAPLLLKHEDPRVRLLGVIWAGEGGMTELRGELEKGLSRSGLSRELFAATLAALEMFDTAADPAKAGAKRDPKKEPTGDLYALRILQDEKAAPDVRTFALKALPPDYPELKSTALVELAGEADSSLFKEIIRTLRERPDDAARKFLRQVAADDQHSDKYRTEAIIALAPDQADDRKLLEKTAGSSDKLPAQEAKRILRRTVAAEPLRSDQVPAGGDPAAGERLFFHPRVASCYRCHEYEGRGASIGPALTTFGRGASRERILQSILEPSREVAPHYVPWLITKTDGLTVTGLYVGEEVDGTHRYADAQGKIFKLHPREIDAREAAKQSIMPADFGKTLTAEELRDLTVFLQQTPR